MLYEKSNKKLLATFVELFAHQQRVSEKAIKVIGGTFLK